MIRKWFTHAWEYLILQACRPVLPNLRLQLASSSFSCEQLEQVDSTERHEAKGRSRRSNRDCQVAHGYKILGTVSECFDFQSLVSGMNLLLRHTLQT